MPLIHFTQDPKYLYTHTLFRKKSVSNNCMLQSWT